MEVTKWLKPSIKQFRIGDSASGWQGRTRVERLNNPRKKETHCRRFDPTTLSGTTGYVWRHERSDTVSKTGCGARGIGGGINKKRTKTRNPKACQR